MPVHLATADPWADPAGTRLVGDPVDVVTGRVTERTLCFRLIGPLFLEWDRVYDSGHNALSRGFGFGHAHAYDHRLSFDADGLQLEGPIGRYTHFGGFRSDGHVEVKRGVTMRRLSLLRYRVTRPGRPAMEFAFSDVEQHARVAQVDRGKARIRFEYDRDGHLVGLTHATGLRIAAAEDGFGRLVHLAGAWDGGAADKPILTCVYDGAGDLVSMTDALGRHGSFAYDADHRLIRRTDRRGYSFLFEYDSVGRCIRSAGEDGVMGVMLRYRTDEHITEVTRSDGGVWKYHYDMAGSITQVVGPYGDIRRFIKGDDGRITGEIDPLGYALDYVFDRGGALVAKRFSTGREIPMEAGQEVADPPFHRVADRASQFLFGDLPSRLPVSADELARLPLELSRTLAPQPDLPARGLEVPPFGVLAWYPQPKLGREFTPFGHLVRQALPDGAMRHWTYDPNDSMYQSTDADGSVIRQERRSWNQLAIWIDPLGHETAYRFTSEDQVAAVTDPGGTATEFAYDKERRLLGVRRAGQVRETYRYDGAGNLVEKRNGDGATLLTFTPTADRLIAERRLASGGVHSFTYNKAGRFLSATVDSSEVQFAYDTLGRRTRDTRDGLGVTHDFTAGPGVETTTVLDRFVITRETVGSRLTIRLPGGAWVCIERLGEQVLQRTCSNGTTELCQYDIMGRCVGSSVVSDRSDARSWTRRWRYSAEGDLLEEDDSRYGTTKYRFDAAHRLVRAERRAGSIEEYRYDAAGNLQSQPGLSGVEIGPGNRLMAANGERLDFNVRHHVSARHGPGGSIKYHYDSRDLLVAVEGPDWAWKAEYDAIGRRVRAWHSDAEQRFLWDNDRLAAEVFASGLLRIYVYADALALTPIAFLDFPGEDANLIDCAIRFVISDQRGAPVLADDAAGQVLWQARLSPFGAATISPATKLTFNLRFPGHYFDEVTGLHYNRFRYYDPTLARYLQSDPIGIGGGVNIYAYPADPLVQVDVRGLSEGAGAACPGEGKAEAKQDEGNTEDSSPRLLLPPGPEPVTPTADELAAQLPGHGHDRHGTQTTIGEQTTRVQTGVAPDGEVAPTPTATKFDSSEAELDAVARARARTDARVASGAQSPAIVVRPNGTATLPRDTSVVTGYPGGYGSGVAVQRDPTTNQPLPGRPVQATGQNPNAVVVLQRNPATGTWDPVTQYPTDRPVTP